MIEVWAVFRDDEFFEAYATRRRAYEIVRGYNSASIASKHRWSVKRCTMTANKGGGSYYGLL